MRRYELTIDGDGGLELPAEIRQALGIEKGGWVTFELVDDVVRISSAGTTHVAAGERNGRDRPDDRAKGELES